MSQSRTIVISRGVTVFPNGEEFHAEELPPPLDDPDADLIKVVIEGNTVTHWWQTARFKVDGIALRAAATRTAAGGDNG